MVHHDNQPLLEVTPGSEAHDRWAEWGEHSSLDESLREFGWRPAGDLSWTRSTATGRAQLRADHDSPTWRRFELTGHCIGLTTAGCYLRDNGCVPGPIKYVARPREGVRCRCDLPVVSESFRNSQAPESAEPLTVQWARAITELVEGRPVSSAPAFDIDWALEELAQTGRSASRDGDRVLIHYQRPGLFGQICCERDPRIGLRLSAELVPLTGRRGPFHRAAVRLAAEANWRLPLVRFVVSGTSPLVLSCEVCFGNALIPSAWLTVALEAVEAAMSLTLRELQALRDPTLARLLIAVATA
jgi:hypothetical protein